LLPFFKKSGLTYTVTDDINAHDRSIKDVMTDHIIISINNGQIFKAPILRLADIRIFNIHNGLLPAYRGAPEVCIIFAILQGEPEYGVSLHSVDEGIDTGVCYAEIRFGIGREDGFQQVMLRSLECCQRLYEQYIERILSDHLCGVPGNGAVSRLYLRKHLSKLPAYVGTANFQKATKLGIFKIWFREAQAMINACN
jgi:methionyl-tRNA formyltransferase